MSQTTLHKTATPCGFDDEEKFIRIGLLVLASDLTSEDDFHKLCLDPRLRLHVTRTAYQNPVTAENLQALKDGIAHSASLLVPEVPLRVIYFSCTSASALLGQTTIQQQIHSVRPGVPVITPVSAASTAFRALSAQRLSILTPYTADVAEAVGNFFREQEFTVNNISFMGLEDDQLMARLTPETIVQLAKECILPDSDALFISCTALRSVQVIKEIEKIVNRPVVTSNQAAAWLAARISNIEPPGAEHGLLMSVRKYN